MRDWNQSSFAKIPFRNLQTFSWVSVLFNPGEINAQNFSRFLNTAVLFNVILYDLKSIYNGVKQFYKVTFRFLTCTNLALEALIGRKSRENEGLQKLKYYSLDCFTPIVDAFKLLLCTNDPAPNLPWTIQGHCNLVYYKLREFYKIAKSKSN